jgi:hypothetical protein
MSKNILILTGIFLSLLACKKELDLTKDSYFGIKELLTSKNASADCGENADIEGKKIKVYGIIDEDNILLETSTFVVQDKDNDKYSLNVEVDSTISEPLFELLMEKAGKEVKIEGKIRGFDAPANFNCTRKFVLQVSSMEAVSF